VKFLAAGWYNFGAFVGSADQFVTTISTCSDHVNRESNIIFDFEMKHLNKTSGKITQKVRITILK
jgi:hypothetical protein